MWPRRMQKIQRAMRVDPSVKAIRGNKVDVKAKAYVQKITRIVALIVCLAMTFGLMIKILFL